ncbi:ribokinase [Asanoa ishikariensis]|uniref:Sugar or nucleoside kinase, ribokinase family n=1 Tax=Asanoa ishikariensis TaxID=137265 RepID=A0A1H3RS67_9ACTN|nr:carbohydrate kinase family protein [Asanoa ishikariensis]GIF66930.1 ribokinase [Asanoa ishikariensis]SDZ28098.1 Sugar or nucleoside kinase, ribokinase family [Asanoa ishikariensis]
MRKGPVRVAVAGDAVTDVVAVLAGPPVPDTDTAAAIRFTGGGQAANTAAWLAWHGVPVTLLATVGADEAGAARLAELRAAGVDCPLPPRRDAPTGTVIVLAEGGRRTMITDRGASLLLDPDEVALALAAAGAGHLHLSGYPLLDDRSRPAGLRALATARDLGLTISVDAASAAPLRQVGGPAFRSWVRGVDLLLANADEAAVLAEDSGADPVDQARALAADLSAAVVVKLGGAGAVWADPDGTVATAPAVTALVVDPTGAGDAFAAGLLATLLAGGDPESCLKAAAAAGARAVVAVGARPVGSSV